MEYFSLECIDWEFSKSNWYYHSILEFQSEHALFRQAWFHVWLPDENGDTHFRCNLSLVFIALLCHISRVFINPLISVDTNGLGLEWILICLMGAWLSKTHYKGQLKACIWSSGSSKKINYMERNVSQILNKTIMVIVFITSRGHKRNPWSQCI